jgi:hypothetical protein
MQGDFFMQRKRGFDDGRDGIKKKPGFTRLFITTCEDRGLRREEKGGMNG